MSKRREREHLSERGRSRVLRTWGLYLLALTAWVTVVLLLAGGAGGYRLWLQGRDYFSVSIHGEKYTRESVLEEQVRAALHNVFEPTPTPEEQLAIVFGSLDEAASPEGEAKDVSFTKEIEKL